MIALALVIGAGVSYASSLNIGSSSILTFASGSNTNFRAPGGTITGYTTSITESSTPGANATLISRFVNSGATWMRTDIKWKVVQAVGSTTYDYASYNQPVTEIKAAGINILAILDYAPLWAAKSPCTPDAGGYGNCAPDSAYYYINYCSNAATHFNGTNGPLITYWEIWNEPNLNFFWGPTADVAAYTQALIGCSQAIKAVNPNAVIVAGAMSGGDVSGTFGAGVYSNGGGPYLDAFSIHPYSAPLSLTNGSAEWRGVATLRATMISNGDSAKPIWITEFGAATCGTGSAFSMDQSGSFGSTDYMTLTAQNEYVSQLITALASQTYIQRVFWYTLKDGNSNDPSTRENCFGSLFSSGNAKPVWASLRSN